MTCSDLMRLISGRLLQDAVGPHAEERALARAAPIMQAGVRARLEACGPAHPSRRAQESLQCEESSPRCALRMRRNKLRHRASRFLSSEIPVESRAPI